MTKEIVYDEYDGGFATIVTIILFVGCAIVYMVDPIASLACVIVIVGILVMGHFENKEKYRCQCGGRILNTASNGRDQVYTCLDCNEKWYIKADKEKPNGVWKYE